MSHSIDPKTVKQVARLAKIQLPDDQIDDSLKQLANVLQYVSQLESVELPDDTQPFFGAIESVNAIREDQVLPSVEREKILKNAPDTDGEFYSVPPVF
ncbi:MAG: Asp-tRNA(Asn)/Glu-tRNA(Gln) amidotransferase subunit GatC [Mariniblastus sp.]